MENKTDVMEVRRKMVDFLRTRGPSLPIHVAKHVNLSTLFASAFLSELLSEKQIKISNMKVGGSPLYYFPGQEAQLERFSNYLGGKEKEAFLLLQNKKLVREEELEPAVRVAVKSLRDFGFPITVNLPDKQVIFWRYISLPEEEAKKQIESLFEKKESVKPEPEKKIEKAEEKIEEKKVRKAVREKKIEEKIEEKKEELKRLEEKKLESEKPLLEIRPVKEKPKTEKPDSEFITRIRNYLLENNIEIIEEIDKRKKEYEAVVRIESDLGKIEFLCVAKDKKGVSENDLTLALEKARVKKKPAFFISSGDASKKAKEYINSWGNMIRFKKLS